ncbi:hypothetical protein J9332_11560 [Aquimarina celericrescens]|nr:hypothetical protein [Aquimarina celericrescens]
MRVTKDRKSSYLSLNWIEEKHWNATKSRVKDSYHSAAKINSLILKKLSKAEGAMLDFKDGDPLLTRTSCSCR